MVHVNRHGRLVARVGFDPDRVDAESALGAAALAAAELDNARLRAELGRRLGEVSASRRRLASAQRRERRRIERDLHDGAQQSLLALALDLQTARLSGDPVRMRGRFWPTVRIAARAALRQLRDLANGLHPAALTDGGYPGGARRPVTALLRAPAPSSPTCLRLDPAPWSSRRGSCSAEAVVNAQKHARATAVDVEVQAGDDEPAAPSVHDDGCGRANPDGSGLRGMRDRVETAARGASPVDSAAGAGPPSRR